MSPSERIAVAPNVLAWARASAGYDQDSAANKLNVSATIGKWETGDLQPTIKQLRKVAKLFRRPLAVLFLPEPPSDFDAMRDFRRLPADRSNDWSPELHREFRRALSQREVFLEIAELSPGVLPDPAAPFATTADVPADDAGQSLREWLGVSAEAQSSWRTQHEALNAWIAAAEAKSVLVTTLT